MPALGRARPGSGIAALALLAGGTLFLHFLVNGRYGFWIDELYFIACGEHLAWGYVDQPPVIAVVAKVSRALLGDSLFAIRFLPAVANAALVFLTGCCARELGGGRFAAVCAAIAALVVPVYLAFGNLLTMNAFEPLLWTATAYVLMLIVKTDNRRLWALIGVLAGVGMLNKYSAAFFTGAVIAGLLLTPERRVLRSPWMLLGGAVGFLIVLPNLLWQLRLDWPTAELMRNAKLYQHQPVTPAEFVLGQIQTMHPFTLPVWIAGLGWYLFAPAARRFRFFGWTFVLLFAGALWSQAKTYYLAPAYPMLFAGGGVALEQLILKRGWTWLKPVSISILLLGGLITAPYVLPVLPVSAIPGYVSALNVEEVRPERRVQGQVPQLFADMLPWEDTVAAVAQVYASLSPDEQSRCAIWGASYGEAGAIDFFGQAYGLPTAISGHQNYYLWGPGPQTGEIMITVGLPGDVLQRWFEQVQLVATVECPYCMPDRATIEIHLCHKLKMPLRDFWPQVKCWTCDTPEFAR